MRPTTRGANVLVALSVVLVLVATPLLVWYAFDYRLVERGTSALDEDYAVPYGNLTGDQRAAVDPAIAGDGPWYRTRSEASIDGNAIVVERGGERYRLVVAQFNAASRRGTGAIAAPSVGVLSLVVATLHHVRSPGGYAQ